MRLPLPSQVSSSHQSLSLSTGGHQCVADLTLPYPIIPSRRLVKDGIPVLVRGVALGNAAVVDEAHVAERLPT